MTTMNKQATFLLLSFLALFSLAAPATGASEKVKANASRPTEALRDLTIFFSNDVRGETEPCG